MNNNLSHPKRLFTPISTSSTSQKSPKYMRYGVKHQSINQSINHGCVFVSGASQFLVGLGSVISCVSEAVMFFGVFYVFKHISHTAFMAFGLIGYIFRFCVFASVTNPWLVLPVEIFQGSELLLFSIQLYFHAFISLA